MNTVASAVSNAGEQPIAGGRTIVIVEDDAEIADLESFLLGAEGYRVVTLSHGGNVHETVKRERADVVVLDLMLPRKHGNLVLEELQSDPETSSIPVVVATAYKRQLRPTPQVKVVLVKPFDVTELLNAIADRLSGK